MCWALRVCVCVCVCARAYSHPFADSCLLQLPCARSCSPECLMLCFLQKEGGLVYPELGSNTKPVDELYSAFANGGIPEFKGKARSVRQVLSGAGVTTVGMGLAR